MKHLRHLLALALAAALTLMLLLPTYAAVIDGVYTDYMTGLKFTIPADWEEYAVPSTMPSYIKEALAYQKDGAFSMMGYGSVDLWMAALSNGQISGTREELDNSAPITGILSSCSPASGTPQRIPTHQSRPFPPAPPIPQRIVPPAAPHPAR